MKKFGFRTLLVLGGLFVALLIAEGALRIIGFSNPNYYTYDSDLGSSLKPGAEGLYKKEGRAYIRINSDGLRDIEHIVTKPNNTFRIAILGDSYAEGLQLDLNKLFWKVLEKKLQECNYKKNSNIEVINFGVSGYGTGRELLMLRTRVWKYQPDMVILEFLTGNDVRDNSKVLNGIKYIPYFNLDEKGKLVLDRSYLDSPEYKARKRLLSKLWAVYGNDIRLIQLAVSVRQAWNKRARVKAKAKAVPGNEVGLDNGVYSIPKEPVWQKAWAVTEALLLQISLEVKSKGADFLLVTISNGIQVHPDDTKRKKFMQEHKIIDLFYPDKRINSFARRYGINVLTLAPIFLRLAKEKNIYMHGFRNLIMGNGHWNTYGHRYAGELISKHLCQKSN